MVYDHGNSFYVPLMYVLMSGKTEWLYKQALMMCIQITAPQGKINPFSVTCDFEKGLHNAVRFLFPRVRINGCLFHWKQAIRRKMKALQIQKLHIDMMMTKNVLDILTVIPRDEIYSKGIPYVKSIIFPVILGDENEVVKMGLFWK